MSPDFRPSDQHAGQAAPAEAVRDPRLQVGSGVMAQWEGKQYYSEITDLTADGCWVHFHDYDFTEWLSWVRCRLTVCAHSHYMFNHVHQS